MRRHALAIAGALLATGCGYEHGWGAPRRYGIRSVSVQTVDNESYRQGFDALLTRQLGSDLPHYTGLVHGTPDGADALLVVRLRDVRGRSITETGGGVISEGALLLAAEVKLVDRRSGEAVYEGRHTDWAEFRGPVGEDLSSATKEAVADLSRRILTAIDDDFLRR